MRKFFGSAQIFSLSSGRAALWLILKAQSRLKPGKKEVLIPAYTCPALASSILKAGLRPALVDITLPNFGLSVEDLQRAAGPDTLAAVIVHLFGFPANVGEINKFCKEKDIFLIEDSAQALRNPAVGSPGTMAGLEGDAGFFSFGRGKPLSVLHGGVAVFGSEDIFDSATAIFKDLTAPSMTAAMEYAVKLCSYLVFSHPRFYWIPEKLSFLHLGETIFEPEFEASKGLRFGRLIFNEMAHLVNEEQVIRERNSLWYGEAFNGLRHVVRPPVLPFPYLRYPLMIRETELRDIILNELRSQGTGAALYYPSPLNTLPGLRDVLQDPRVYENAEKISKQLITLPVHSGVTPRDLEAIKSIVLNAAATWSNR
ncbi:MAG TPA: DegT/DnrJ/EryC1/StrS family aminotransferase [Syntrophorhabdaceae bacterium]|jgi:dTDP-4-amino-4,6-dideoxygalactose transaminase